jgi:hypothetical protein
MGMFNKDPKLGLNRTNLLSPEEGAALWFEQEAFTFAIVRNPIVRTLSAWLDKGRKYKTFDEFVKSEMFLGEHICSPLIDQHWRPQICSCGFHIGSFIHNYKFIGRFEELPEVVTELGKILVHFNCIIDCRGARCSSAGNCCFWMG